MTKFVVLRPLKSKRETDVAIQILDIFLLFGAPNILQSDNGAEFTASIISQLKGFMARVQIRSWEAETPTKPGKC